MKLTVSKQETKQTWKIILFIIVLWRCRCEKRWLLHPEDDQETSPGYYSHPASCLSPSLPTFFCSFSVSITYKQLPSDHWTHSCKVRFVRVQSSWNRFPSLIKVTSGIAHKSILKTQWNVLVKKTNMFTLWYTKLLRVNNISNASR